MEVTSWWQKDEYLRLAYFALVIARFLFPCFVQNGYLYPDEFFQSSEIMAKDILQINSTVTWEWNEAFPVRSPVSAFLASGIPFLILSSLSKLKLVHISPYFLLIFPRIYITFTSVISYDIPVYVVSRRLKLKPFQCLFVLSTSYVTHVLATRPFSNTLETGIFGLLLMLLIKCTGNKVINKPDTTKDRLGDNDIQSYTCILIGSLTSLGLFCRQTFLVFALVPYLGYIIDQIKRKNGKLQIVCKLIFMAFGFLATTLVFVLLDSWYFGYLQYGKIVLTLWKFLKYNSLQSHTHGHHPFVTHFFINIPLLFGPVAILFYLKLGSLLLFQFYHPIQDQQTQNQLDAGSRIFYKVLLLLSILVPVLILSFIPHQEPRFIMPVLIPLVWLFASKIVGPKYSPMICISWMVWNVIGCIFFGVLHQGGVVPSLLHLHKVIDQTVQNSTDSLCHHVVYFHTYTPPTHLLAWPKSCSLNGHKLYIHDLAGSSHETFDQRMSKLKSDYCARNKNMVYIVYPGTVQIPRFEKDLNVVTFFPHLTMEDPPNFHQHLTDLFFSKIDHDFDTFMHNMNIRNISRTYWNHVRSRMEKLKSELSLKLYTTQF